MNISIITPHYNDFNGLQHIYKCLRKQSQASWQWVIVDDLSETSILKQIHYWHQRINDNRVQLICNDKKSNASICRNVGAEIALYENLIFFMLLYSRNFIRKELVV